MSRQEKAPVQREQIEIPIESTIRKSAHPDTKCRTCRFICNDCSKVNYYREVWNGYWVVLECDEYEEQRK